MSPIQFYYHHPIILESSIVDGSYDTFTYSLENETFPNSTEAPESPELPEGDSSLSNLLPAIVQCFAVIFFGYLSARLGWVSDSQSHGLRIFVSKYAMPAVLFKSMCELSFNSVNWEFLAAVAVGKSLAFVLVLILTAALVRPLNLGKMGIYGIFVTQSHDLALGIPIVEAIYSVTHPDYEQYLYLIAPISVAFLNPIGFFMMEYHTRKQIVGTQHQKSTGEVLKQVIFGVISNPIVFMTLLGIGGNFIFHQKVPPYLDEILIVLKNAFPATALYCLGLSMSGQFNSKMVNRFMTPALLIGVKMLLSPFLIRQLVVVFQPPGNNGTADIANFGFLYGMIPTAPTVYIYASLYHIEANLMALGLVVSTFLAAPLMYISGKMVSMTRHHSDEEFTHQIEEASFDVSILSLICCFWVAFVFIVHKKIFRIPHQFTSFLIISQILTAIAMILYWSIGTMSETWYRYIQFAIYINGLIGSRCWMSMLAISLALLKSGNLQTIRKWKFMFIFYGAGIPILICGLFMIFDDKLMMPHEFNPFTRKSTSWFQRIFMIVFLSVNLLISSLALVIGQRLDVQLVTRIRGLSSHSTKKEEVRQRNAESETRDPLTDRPVDTQYYCRRLNKMVDRVCQSAPPVASYLNDDQPEECSGGQCDECKHCEVQNIEDIVPDVRQRSKIPKKTVATSDIEELEEVPYPDDQEDHVTEGHLNEGFDDSESGISSLRTSENLEGSGKSSLQDFWSDEPVINDFQYERHMVLILFLMTSAFLGLATLIWKELKEDTSGVYIEIKFLDCILLYGQGFFTFVVFGFDADLIIEPVMRRIKKWYYGSDEVRLRAWTEIDISTQLTCIQFQRFHQEACQRAFMREKRYRFRNYKNVFHGYQLVDWLIEVGLASDRQGGEVYGKRLLEGKIIQHLQKKHHFFDHKYLYELTDHVVESFDYIPAGH